MSYFPQTLFASSINSKSSFQPSLSNLSFPPQPPKILHPKKTPNLHPSPFPPPTLQEGTHPNPFFLPPSKRAPTQTLSLFHPPREHPPKPLLSPPPRRASTWSWPPCGWTTSRPVSKPSMSQSTPSLPSASDNNSNCNNNSRIIKIIIRII